MHYQNPIIKGFNPDPSICRVGNEYYLAASSFEYFPGIPIYHSTDLVNWVQLGNAIDRPGQLPMALAKPSGGIWAPTLRYHRGTFYLTATFAERGNFIITSPTPGTGWSDPVWVEMAGLDPSLFFEDDALYYCANDFGRAEQGEGISVARVDPVTGRTLSPITRIWQGTGGGFLEAPHLYHVGDWYYLFAAEGGTGLNHMETVARSRQLLGPYAGDPENPLLTNRHDTTKQALCCGHADLVEDTAGNWWIVHLGIRPAAGSMSHLGRETFLTPICWVNGWPKVLPGRRAAITSEGPLTKPQLPRTAWRDNFTKTAFGPEWLFVKEPVPQNYTRTGGTLVLRPTTALLTGEGASPTFAAVRPLDFDCLFQTELLFAPAEQGDEAGLALYLSPRYNYRIGVRRAADGDRLVVEKHADDFTELAFCAPAGEGKIRLIVRAAREQYAFYYAWQGQEPRLAATASTRFLCCELAGKCFTGTLAGLYAQAETETTAAAVFYDFSQTAGNEG